MLSHPVVYLKESVDYAVIKTRAVSLNQQNHADENIQRKNTEILARRPPALGGRQRGGSLGICRVAGCAESNAVDE